MLVSGIGCSVDVRLCMHCPPAKPQDTSLWVILFIWVAKYLIIHIACLSIRDLSTVMSVGIAGAATKSASLQSHAVALLYLMRMEPLPYQRFEMVVFPPDSTNGRNDCSSQQYVAAWSLSARGITADVLCRL